MMLFSRFFTSLVLKYQNPYLLNCSRCFLSNQSVEGENDILSCDNSISNSTSINANNDWLWAYLRDRKPFSDLDKEQRQQVIGIELQTFRESGEPVPEKIPDERWEELLNTSSIESRKNLYRYLFLRETYKKRRIATVEANNVRRIEAAKRRQRLVDEGKPPTNYPGYSSIFRHLGRHNEKYLRERLLLPSARLGESVVIDCSFENQHAREHYVLNLVDQVQYLFAEIERYHSPSFVYLCNLSMNGRLADEFRRRTSLESQCFETSQSSYLDIFPHEKLIYLSPDSDNEMSSFDHDAVYIIGGIIDLSGKKPLTLGKAKRENIRHQRFPIDRYVKFGGGSGKTLTIDQVYNILMTLKHTGSWIEAFKYIPERKIVQRYSEKKENNVLEYEKLGHWTKTNVKHKQRI